MQRLTPRKLYAIAALIEVITWAGLLTGMALKYSGITPAVVPITGGIHGFGFLLFCVSTVIVWINNKWSFGRGFTGLIMAVIPFATIPFERATDRAGLLQADWRFLPPAAEEPANVFERILAWYTQKPLLAALVTLIGLVVVFLVLLNLGSPLEALKN